MAARAVGRRGGTRDRNSAGTAFRRSEGSDGSGDEALETRGPDPLSGAGTVVTRPAGVGDYRWIGDAAALDSLVDELVSCEVYALDTEFHRERTYFPQLALIQLAWQGGRAGRALQTRVAIAVVGRAFLRIAQNAVSLRRLLEILFGVGVVRIAVGMELEGELAVCALDLRIAGVLADTQHFVIVSLRHGIQCVTVSLPPAPWRASEACL